MSTDEIQTERHRTLVAVRSLLFLLTDAQRIEFFDGVEDGFCVGCGKHCPAIDEFCACLGDTGTEEVVEEALANSL